LIRRTHLDLPGMPHEVGAWCYGRESADPDWFATSLILHRGEGATMVAAIQISGDCPGTVISGNLIGTAPAGGIVTPPRSSDAGMNHPAAPTPRSRL
jgi:hypothetical protein